MTPSHPMAHRFVRFVVVLAIFGGLVNFGGELALPAESRSIHLHAGGTLGGLLPQEHEPVRDRYQIYAQLRDLASGASIVIPRDVLDTAALEYLSGLAVERSEETRRIPEATLRGLPDPIRYRGVTEPTVGSAERFPYVVATVDDTPDRLVVYVTRTSNTLLVVDPATATAMELP